MPATPLPHGPLGPFLPTDRDGWPGRSRLTLLLAAVAVVVCSLPLFVGLDRQDIENDEAIYTYAVQRMVQTGEWLTPRYVGTDGLFLEKPPLKIWLAAIPVTLGWIPDTVAGIRLVDAALGAGAFAYVMALGWRIGGLVCGATALVLLLAYHPLLFNHGLRENNMESALVLSYAAGLYHFISWTAAATRAARRRHATVTALWFVLGFMTKFVAALFLPLVGLAVLVAAPGGWTFLTRHWRDWIIPAITSALLVTPWFVYQAIVHPDDFWVTIFGAHVYVRFTTFVDPAHVQPWHFYLTDSWARLETNAAGYRRLHDWDAARVLVVGGLAYVLSRLHGPGRSTAVFLLLWCGLPIALISVGTSKVTHYAYPFLPAVALAAGWLCSRACAAADRIGADRLHTWRVNIGRSVPAMGFRWRMTVWILAGGLVLLAVATFIGGPVEFAVGDARLFRSSSALRPVVIAALLLAWIGQTRTAVRLTTVAILVLMLPIESAARTIERARVIHRPLHASQACLSELTRTRPELRRGLYRSDHFDPHLAVHQLYYSLRSLGPWVEGMDRFADEVPARLNGADTQSPMLLSPSQWHSIRDSSTPVEDGSEALRVAPEVVLVLPGPYRACGAPIRAAGGTPPGEAAGQ